MKLMMYEHGGSTKLGAVIGDEVVDLKAADSSLPADILGMIEGGDAALAKAKAAADAAPDNCRMPIADAKPARPIERPEKFFCIGLNYALHAKEGGHDIPTYPSMFTRVPGSIIPAGAEVIKPKSSEQLDYECELAIIIGKGGRHITEDNALDHVFGYTLFNDVSVRDFQRKIPQWIPGKNFDATGPFGPHVVTADELPLGASGLRIMTRVNGQTMQDSNTADMIFSTAKIIAILSEFMTLSPGDVIAAGTPSGVAHARKPPAWMKAGDVVEVEVEGIGILKNPIVDET